MHADSQIATRPLAGRVLNREAKGGSPGTRFVQRSDQAKQAKMKSRLRILELFGQRGFDEQLRILTFPSTNWVFEGMLLNNRHGRDNKFGSGWKYMKGTVGHHTMLVGIEREEPIYRLALNLMPSVKHGFRVKDCPPYATASLRAFAVKRYLRCEFEEMAVSEVPVDCQELKFNGAWLDFNGYLSMRRKDAVEAFLKNHTTGTCRLVITAADCRYDVESQAYWGKDKLARITAWLESLGGVILHSTRYSSTTPMIEVAVDHRQHQHTGTPVHHHG